MKAPALLGVLLMFGGCGHRRAVYQTWDSAAAVTATEQQIAQQQAKLTAEPVAGKKPDCIDAFAVRDNVCALGRRVCLLVDGDRAIADGPARCKKATLECQKASTYMSGTCRKSNKARYSRR